MTRTVCNMFHRLLAIALSASVAACANLQLQELPSAAALATAPATWQAPLPHNGQPTELANWWQQFRDPALSLLIESAQNNSVSVAAAHARIEQSRATLAGAQAALGPTLDALGSLSRGQPDVSARSGISAAASLQAQWEIDIFGRNGAARDAALARLDSASASWHDARVSVAAEVAQQYTTLRACEAQLVQTRLDAQSRQETARLTDLTARAGFQAPSSAALTRASAAQGSSLLTQQTAQCTTIVKALVAMTGLDEPGLRGRLADNAGLLPAPAFINVSSVPAQAMAQRPDLTAAARNVLASSADIASSKALLQPRISLGGSIGAGTFASGNLTNSGATWNLGPVSLTVPLFDGGRQRANIEAARARYDESVAVYAATMRLAVREVEEALITLQSTAARNADAQIASDGFAASYIAAQARYRGGLSNLFELEDARRSALQAQGALIELQRERVAAWISLYRALGGGWTNSP